MVARIGGLVAACGVLTCAYVGSQALQEDNDMGPWSPLAWLLVDARLWHLEPPESCTVVGYYTTTGDGPKLPGSDVTLHCAMTHPELEAWLRQWLKDQSFRAQGKPSGWPADATAPTAMDGDTDVADYLLADLPDGRVSLRLTLHDRPR